jgi:hypothetical protein
MHNGASPYLRTSLQLRDLIGYTRASKDRCALHTLQLGKPPHLLHATAQTHCALILCSCTYVCCSCIHQQHCRPRSSHTWRYQCKQRFVPMLYGLDPPILLRHGKVQCWPALPARQRASPAHLADLLHQFSRWGHNQPNWAVSLRPGLLLGGERNEARRN